MKLKQHDITALKDHERVFFINSLSGFKSANLVGTANEARHTNLAIVSSVVHLGANPPLLAMVMRPGSDLRGTLKNILDTGVYTLNHVNVDIHQQAHQTSARYAENLSEFDEVGLSAQWENGFNAPFVQESRIKIGMEFRERHTLAINGTEFIIGEVVSIEMPDDVIAEDGFVSLEKAGTLAISSLDTYHSTQTLASLSYAKPDKKVSILERKIHVQTNQKN
jgi:flavin reductase (DIM6/NTAB) family NADH-FMN oxidoreductase RutF